MLLSPHAQDAVEHYERSVRFFNAAVRSADREDGYRQLVTSAYYGRAVLEVMRERARVGALQVSRREFDRRLARLLPRWRLVKAIRIQDFHRSPLTFDGRMVGYFQIRLPARVTAVLSIANDPNDPRPEVIVSDGSSRFSFLVFGPNLIQDEREAHAVRITTLMAEYLNQMPAAIDEYDRLLRLHRGRGGNPVGGLG